MGKKDEKNKRAGDKGVRVNLMVCKYPMRSVGHGEMRKRGIG